MFYNTKEDLIEYGLLNKFGNKDKCIGYTPDPCINCGRTRVELYESGMRVCEKCDFDQNAKSYVDDKYYANNY